MPRPYLGPKLWLDKGRGTWTILDGRKNVRTSFTEAQHDQAVLAIHQYSNGTYNPDRPKGPVPTYKTPPRKGVYVVGFGPYVKIGVTINIDIRIAALQTPEPVRLFALIEGWTKEERALHARFAEYRLQGEWFLRKGELAEWIDRGCRDLEKLCAAAQADG
jgi:T5orf172 domain